jgi:hypothetical protein
MIVTLKQLVPCVVSAGVLAGATMYSLSFLAGYLF